MSTDTQSTLFKILSQKQKARLDLDADLSWPALFEQADEWRLLIALWNQLNQFYATNIPSELGRQIEERVTSKVLEQARRSRELASLMDLLSSQKIRALSYKGPTLAQMAFGSSASRVSGDLDLLVAPEQFAETVSLLLAEGFHYEYQQIPKCYLKLAFHEIAFLHPQRQIAVDLHRAFFPPTMRFPINVHNRRPYTLKLGGSEVDTLDPEETFLVTCLHASKHAWCQPRWLYDLYGLMTSHDLDWTYIYTKGAESRALPALRTSLLLVQELFAVESPSLFHPTPSQRELAKLSLEFITGVPPTRLQLHHYHWRLNPGLADRIKWVWYTMIEPHELDLKWVDLPEKLWPLYYLLRPLRVFYQRINRSIQGFTYNT